MAAVPTRNIYFVRHGERIDWVDKTWIKTAERPSDPSLSPNGFQQARELGLYVAQIRPQITHIYTSPFLRTIQTALQITHELNKNAPSMDKFIKIRLEPGYGEYISDEWNRNNIYQPPNQFVEFKENISHFDQDYDSIIKADYYLQTRVETRQQLRNRLKRVLQSTLDANQDECNILIVTHAAPLIEGARALSVISREQSQTLVNKEEIKITTNQEEGIVSISTWEMLPIRAGVCSLTHFELIDNKWNLSKNGLASFLSKGEENPWIFPDDVSIYATS